MNETVNISCYQSVCDLDQNNILQKIHINSRADCSGWQNHVILHSDVLNSLVKSQGLAKTVWWTCVVWFSYTVWKFADTTDNHFDGNYIFSIWRKVFSALTEHQLRSKGQYLYQLLDTSGQQNAPISMEDWMNTLEWVVVTISAAGFWRQYFRGFWLWVFGQEPRSA